MLIQGNDTLVASVPIRHNLFKDIFAQINGRINDELEHHPEYKDNVALQKQHIPYVGELFLGHVRYGTFGKNSIENVHPFLTPKQLDAP